MNETQRGGILIMAFFDKLNDLAKSIGDKTEDTIEITKLNSKISSRGKEINRVKEKIGEYYYEKYSNGLQPDEDILALFKEIDDHNLVITESKAAIAAINAPSENVKNESTVQDSSIPKAIFTEPAVQDSSIPKAIFTEPNVQESAIPQAIFTETTAQESPISESTIFCGNCGAKNSASTNFCSACGSKL